MVDEESICWKNRGDQYIEMAQYEEAARCYENATRLNPFYLSAWNNLGYSLSKLGKTDDAKKIKAKLSELKQKETADELDVIKSFKIDTEIKQESTKEQIKVQRAEQTKSQVLARKSFKIFGSIGGAVKSGTRRISYSLLLKNHINHIKKLIIAEFSLRELKKMCLYFSIGEPAIPRLNRDNELVFLTPTYTDWTKHASKHIPLEKLKEYAKMHNKFPYKIAELEKKYKQERVKKYPDYEKNDGFIPTEISADSCDNELLQELINTIGEYRPIKPFKNELLYHTNLYTYLCEKITGEIGFEEQRGSSRPDIVVGDIAIEIKGPTDRHGLMTIADKINRYSQYFDHVIVVLFEVEVYDRYYHEWHEGIVNQYQNQVTIIRK